METSCTMALRVDLSWAAKGSRRWRKRVPRAWLVVLSCALFTLSTPSVAQAATESAPEPPLLLWGVREGCTRLPKVETALIAHLNRMGEHLIECAAQQEAKPTPCSGVACAAQLPADCKQSAVRLLGAEIQREGTLTKLQLWLTTVPLGGVPARPRMVQDACENCDEKSIRDLLISRAGELTEGRETTGGMCSPQAAVADVETTESAAPPITLLAIDLAEKERTVRTAVESYLTRLGHQVIIARRRLARACASQECLNTLAQNYKSQGVTQILAIADGPQPATPQLFVYDPQSRRAEQRNIDCESCDESQLATTLAEAAGQLAVRCLRDSCVSPVRAQERTRPQGACTTIAAPQCESTTAKVNDLPRGESRPASARRIGGGILIGVGAAILAGSLTWSLLSRTSLNQSLVATKSCDYNQAGAVLMGCQINNFGGVDIAGSFVGAAALTGGILLLKLPLARPVLVATSAERK